MYKYDSTVPIETMASEDFVVDPNYSKVRKWGGKALAILTCTGALLAGTACEPKSPPPSTTTTNPSGTTETATTIFGPDPHQTTPNTYIGNVSPDDHAEMIFVGDSLTNQTFSGVSEALADKYSQNWWFHSGWGIGQMLDGLTTQLADTEHPPNYALINLGSNDVNNIDTNSINELDEMFNMLDNSRLEKIILCTIESSEATTLPVIDPQTGGNRKQVILDQLNSAIIAKSQANPERYSVIDFGGFLDAHPEYRGVDTVHMNGYGIPPVTNFIVDSINSLNLDPFEQVENVT